MHLVANTFKLGIDTAFAFQLIYAIPCLLCLTLAIDSSLQGNKNILAKYYYILLVVMLIWL